MFVPTEPIDEEENELGGRINSQLPFEDALKVLLKGDVPEVQPGDEIY
jgi:hypothetical protein